MNVTVYDHRYLIGDKVVVLYGNNPVETEVEIISIISETDKCSTDITYRVRRNSTKFLIKQDYIIKKVK